VTLFFAQVTLVRLHPPNLDAKRAPTSESEVCNDVEVVFQNLSGQIYRHNVMSGVVSHGRALSVCVKREEVIPKTEVVLEIRFFSSIRGKKVLKGAGVHGGTNCM
jgi:hypothetical protein